MDLRLKNKAALVAGGSMGLGLAVAKMLATEGARIAIGALDDSKCRIQLRHAFFRYGHGIHNL